ncbi:MAG: PGF-pre-PGF domain-containing protein [Candidatus Aenigmatarchaeota archaeon]
MNKGTIGKVSFFALVLTISLILIFNIAFADVSPGGLQGYNMCGGSPCPTWVNLTKGDMFFTDGDDVFIIANISCAFPPGENICNSSMTVDANFSQIGGNEVRPGVFKQNGTDASWAIFEFNDTVDFTSLSVEQIQPKNITLNATVFNTTSDTYETYDLPSFVAPILLVNMSTFGCPPEAPAGGFPAVRGYNISVDGQVPIPVPAEACTQNATLCSNMYVYGPGTWDDVASQWKICAPTFGGATTNFSQIASTGNFSAIPNFTIEVLGKAKIVFNTNVSFSSQQESQAIMEFAMKSAMSGGRIGINDTEYDGSNNRPNLNLSATLTIYNISGQTGITGRPQITRSNYDSSNPQSCPASICSGVSWDGENITFTVSSFSSYEITDSINVTLATPATTTWKNNRTVNFTYVPVFNGSVTMSNCTLVGNFTTGWAANATNSTRPLVSGAVNWIVNTVNADDTYAWNVECYDNSGLGDAGTSNYTFSVDSIAPTWSDNNMSAPTNYSAQLSRFNITVNDSFGISKVLITIGNTTVNIISDAQMSNTTYGNGTYNYSALLPAGTWNWSVRVNDTLNNINISYQMEFSIGKNTPDVSVAPLTAVTYGTSTQTGCQRTVGDSTSILTLLMNGTIVASGTTTPQNETSIVLGAAVYNYTCTISDTQNYTASSELDNYRTVNKGTLGISISGTNKTYPNSVYINGTSIGNSADSDVNYTLWRNNTLVGSGLGASGNISDTSVLTAGFYVYTYNSTGGANWTLNSTGVILDVNVSKGALSATLYLNNSTSSQNSTYPNSTINVTAVSNVSGKNVTILRNGALLANSTTSANNTNAYPVSDNNFTAIVYGDENYTDSSVVSLWWNVSKGPTSVTLYLNGSSTNQSSTYPNAINATATSNISGLYVQLWRNGTLIHNATSAWNVTQYNVSYSNFTAQVLGNENYSSSSAATLWFNLTKGTPTLSLVIDDSASDKSVIEGASTTVTGSGCPAELTCTLYRNSAAVTNGALASTTTVGVYNYTYNNTATANYTAASVNRTLTVTAAPLVVNTGSGGSLPAATTKVTLVRGNANITVPSIAAGKMANVTISKIDDMALRQMNISVQNSVNNIKIVISKLSGLPSSITHVISGKVYHYINISKTNITDAEIDKVYFKFAVNKTWMNQSGVANSNISMYRWANSRWNELTTTFVSEDTYEIIYQAETPGLSYFMIGTKAGEVPNAPVVCIESWTCTAWSACANGSKTRTCTDSKSCGTNVNMPAESETCVVVSEINEVAPVAVDYMPAVFALLIIVAIVMFAFRHKILHKVRNHHHKYHHKGKDFVPVKEAPAEVV